MMIGAALMIVAQLAGAGSAGSAMAPASNRAAPSDAPACPAVPAALPAPFAGWNGTRFVAAGVDAKAADAIVVGEGVRAKLHLSLDLHFVAAMKHVGTPAQFGGTLSFVVAEPGRYRVALAAPAWIDVVADGATLPSVGHAHGPDCSGIRKTVDFELRRGRYLLQVAGSDTATLRVMVTPAR